MFAIELEIETIYKYNIDGFYYFSYLVKVHISIDTDNKQISYQILRSSVRYKPYNISTYTNADRIY